MSRQHHYLKCETEYFQAVECGKKKFELRKNDRQFQPGDMVYLQEVVNGEPTGRELPPVEIKHVLLGGRFGLDPGYCIFNW
jgi:ASC-1-like (ASCH) protein